MNIQEVEDLKKQLEAEYKKRTEAIDIVLELLKEKKPSDKVHNIAQNGSASEQKSEESGQKQEPLPSHQLTHRKFDFGEDEASDKASSNGANGNLYGNKFGRVRDAGVKGIAKQAVPFLPQYFTRKDLQETMEKHFPDWASKFTKDAMNGAIDRLKEDSLIEVHEKKGGKFPIVYRKVKPA